jgi:hypothetical protein
VPSLKDPESVEASSAADPHAAAFCERAYGSVERILPFPDSLFGRFFVMFAQPHFAEDAFALHLPLQYLERLIDIVVTDENLHATFLFT